MSGLGHMTEAEAMRALNTAAPLHYKTLSDMVYCDYWNGVSARVVAPRPGVLIKVVVQFLSAEPIDPPGSPPGETTP